MSDTSTITTSGGLLTAAFIEALREPGARLRGRAPEFFRPDRFRANVVRQPVRSSDVEADIAAAWELLVERWDAVRARLPLLEISQVRTSQADRRHVDGGLLLALDARRAPPSTPLWTCKCAAKTPSPASNSAWWPPWPKNTASSTGAWPSRTYLMVVTLSGAKSKGVCFISVVA